MAIVATHILPSWTSQRISRTAMPEDTTLAQTSQAIQGGLLSVFGQDDTNDAVPYAYLNYLVFDEAMNPVAADRARLSTTGANAYERLHFDGPISITANGFIWFG
jgi:hypothetical protein